MIKKESNSVSSFEIVEKKLEDGANNYEKIVSLASSDDSISSQSSVPHISSAGGNLLSNVAPPSALPDFRLWPSNISSNHNEPLQPILTDEKTIIPDLKVFKPVQSFPSPEFSAAIPPSKSFHGHVQQISSECSHTEGGGLMEWMKEAVSGSGILSKVAEKAKNSVDSLITTLDPQMSEYLNSGGDLKFTVASNRESEVSSIREAVHSIFGKAWINGVTLSLPSKTHQSVGFDEAISRANIKLQEAFKKKKTPIVAIESFLFQENDNWYDLKVLILKDFEKDISVQTFTQAIPMPVNQFLQNSEAKVPEVNNSGDTGIILANYIQKMEPGWQDHISGVSQREIIILAAKVLLKSYKNNLEHK